MAFKFVISLALLAVVGAVEYQYQGYQQGYQQDYQQAAYQPAYHTGPAVIKAAPALIKTVQYEQEAPAEYDFSYSVHDEHTGDIKQQQESRKGDTVHGQYSLIDSDGHRRTVEYTADAHHGFNAVVHREPTDYKVPVPQQVAHYAAAPVAKIAVAPVAQYAAAPVHYASGPQQYSHNAGGQQYHY